MTTTNKTQQSGSESCNAMSGGLRENRMMRAVAAVKKLTPFISRGQLVAMADGCRGEEKDFFFAKFDELAALIEGMPVSCEQDGKGDAAIVSLHYFMGGSDWYILEKDIYGGVRQAFGYAVLNGDDECAELGYISIQELTRYGADLDLHFTPRSLGAIKAERATASQPAPRNPNPWVIVTNPGQDDEDIFADFATFAEAVAELPEADEGAQVMKRREDGTLTTEF